MKKNNPFKMLGSWIGAGIAFLSNFTLIPQTIFSKIPFLKDLTIKMATNNTYVWYDNSSSTQGFIYTMIIGFLIGWGIQSLFSKKGRRK